MKWYNLLLLLNIFVLNTNSFFLPQIFREWHPIAIHDKIDKTKPYIINYGKLPLILWYNNTTTPQTRVGYCKHLGAKLDKGFINNNCLVCPNHLTVHNASDTIGTTIIKDGIVWWSYKNLKKTPPSLFKNKTNINYYYMDVNNSLQNIILEFMHSNHNINEKTINNKFLINKQSFNVNHRIFYKYPFYLKGSINRKINYGINFLPLEENKTRLFINLDVDIKYLLHYYLHSKLYNLKNYDENTIFKYLMVLNEVGNKNYMKKIYLLFDKYLFPNENTVFSFYKYRNFY
jgi:hypothetical protein